MTQITNFRLSFIWVETIPAILSQEVNPEALCAFLGHVGKYAQAFDKCRSKSGSPGLELPWMKPQGNHYWRFYFAGQQAGDVAGAAAWQKWVPLRARLPCHLSPVDGEAKVTFEVFYAPPGIALVANAYYRGAPKSPLDITELAQAIRYQVRFKTDPGQTIGGKLLNTAADYGLEQARLQAVGTVPAYAGHNQPFSIATFIEGTDADENAPLTEGSDEHRTLEAITGWNPNYATMNLAKGSLAAASLPAKTLAAGDLVYASKLGRAIWLPREFANPPRAPRLSCYHRNLLLASLQTLSLGEFVDWVAKSHQAKQSIRPLLCERAKQAVDLLETGAAGDPALTYRSKSIDALVTAAKWGSSMEYIKQL